MWFAAGVTTASAALRPWLRRQDPGSPPGVTATTRRPTYRSARTPGSDLAPARWRAAIAPQWAPRRGVLEDPVDRPARQRSRPIRRWPRPPARRRRRCDPFLQDRWRTRQRAVLGPSEWQRHSSCPRTPGCWLRSTGPSAADVRAELRRLPPPPSWCCPRRRGRPLGHRAAARRRHRRAGTEANTWRRRSMTWSSIHTPEQCGDALPAADAHRLQGHSPTLAA